MINGFPEKIVRLVTKESKIDYEYISLFVTVGDKEYIKKCKEIQSRIKREKYEKTKNNDSY